MTISETTFENAISFVCSLELMIFQENCLLRFYQIKPDLPVRNFFLKLSMNALTPLSKLIQTTSDNGLEYHGNEQNHAFMKLCKLNGIEQKFTFELKPSKRVPPNKSIPPSKRIPPFKT